MLCLVHGYGLTGSGSNQWTRSIAEGMVANGETVHVVCQEARADQFDFVAEAFTYDPSGRPTQEFRRDVPFDGACVVHRPELDVLPTYVRPKASNTYMASILDLSDAQVEEYLQRNEVALRHVVTEHDISAVQVNHVVLMAEAVRRVCTKRDIPFGVLPHGSAIEYIVRHDDRMHRLAANTLSVASRIFVLSDELRERIQAVFPGVRDAAGKMVPASAGVDTRRFQLVERDDRAASSAALSDALRSIPPGKTRAQRERLRRELRDDLTLDELQASITATDDHPPKLPDEGLEDELGRIDWLRDELVLFVGKLIGYKGLPSLVAAFPEVAARNDRARLIIAGRGNLRGGLEALVYALADGRRRLVENMVRWGGAIEGEAEEPFHRVSRYFDYLAARDMLEAYFETASSIALAERILFAGYLEHDLLRHLFPCCDVAIFPSVVKEAAPLVVPEAMASGCFPMGTDYAGMAASLNVAAEAVPDDVAKLMRLRHDEAYTVRDIVDQLPAALSAGKPHRASLREVAVRRYDWQSVADSLATEMRRMEVGDRRSSTV